MYYSSSGIHYHTIKCNNNETSVTFFQHAGERILHFSRPDATETDVTRGQNLEGHAREGATARRLCVEFGSNGLPPYTPHLMDSRSRKSVTFLFPNILG